MPSDPLKILVLAGGPDKERQVSLHSGRCVRDALRQAGHEVRQSDIGPNRLDALDAFVRWGGDVIFPVLHGPWGEGGCLQSLLDARGLVYVGSQAPAARLCMDKHATKRVLGQHQLPTPIGELVALAEAQRDDGAKTATGGRGFMGPVVIKPNDEGSSIDLHICRDDAQIAAALAALGGKYEQVLIEQFVAGMELTVTVLGTGKDAQALPVIRIVPSEAVTFYDYEAKYTRDDTQYLLSPEAIGLPAQVLTDVQHLAEQAHRVTGCRHLSRVDLIVDEHRRPWILEVNTLPGFTTHSLAPKAAADAGLSMPMLVDRLVRMAVASPKAAATQQ